MRQAQAAAARTPGGTGDSVRGVPAKVSVAAAISRWRRSRAAASSELSTAGSGAPVSPVVLSSSAAAAAVVGAESSAGAAASSEARVDLVTAHPRGFGTAGALHLAYPRDAGST